MKQTDSPTSDELAGLLDAPVMAPAGSPEPWLAGEEEATPHGPRFVRTRWPGTRMRGGDRQEDLRRRRWRLRAVLPSDAKRLRLVTEPPYAEPALDTAGVPSIDRALPGRGVSPTGALRAGRRLLSGAAWVRLQVAVDLGMLAVVTGWSIGATESSPDRVRGIWLYPLIAVGVMWLRKMYAPRQWRSILDVLIAAFVAISLTTMGVVTAAVFAGYSAAAGPLALQVWLAAVVAVCLGRTSLLLIQRWARRNGQIGNRVLIVGTGEIGSKVVRGLHEHPEYGLVPVGMLDLQPAEGGGDRQVPLVGAPGDMMEAALRMRAQHLILAFSRVPDRDLLTQVRECQKAGLRVSLVPRMFESPNERAEVFNLGTLPIVSLRGVDPEGWQFKVKYVLDRVVAAVALLLLLPLFLVITVSMKLSSGGPVFFRQRRVGLDGRSFDLLKFRSMHEPRKTDAAFVATPGLAPGGVEGIDRRTGIGRLLRRTCLDELPQLINVFRGDMSLIGPRPERPEYVEAFEPEVRRYGDRHRAKSGITGWAQVHGLRGQTSLAERIEYDNQYIDNWSLGLDLRILALTASAVFANKGD